MNYKKYLILFCLTIPLICYFIYAGKVKDSKHNLSAGGPGGMKATDTSMVCIFCHTSHSGRGRSPMWNRDYGAPVYTLYDSSTLNSVPGQPDGASKLCLSCHDGTIALGRVINPGKTFNVTGTSMGKIPPAKRTNLGSDLSDDHPVSFEASTAVSGSAELNHPPLNDPVAYDKNGKIQCTSCHDPHNDDQPNFLAKNNQNSLLCKTCHNLTGFAGASTHDVSTATWSGQGQTPWPHTEYTSVAGNSCQNCHHSHQAAGKHWLLSSDLEEEVCIRCHDGRVGTDINATLNRSSSHRVNLYNGIHDPAENILTASVHVECVDCHNPHQLNDNPASAPQVSGSLKGVLGMNINGSTVNESLYQYEVCLKCHGQDRYQIPVPKQRMFAYNNIREAILPSNASYHAVASQGKAVRVPSLLPPWTTSSRLYCTDCHNSSSGAKGPHGSSWDFLLEQRYEMSDYTNYSQAYYALCFKCHDVNRLISEGISTFPAHDKHMREEDAPCSVCHDPHGSDNPSLINFDLNVVNPDSQGRLRFEIIGDKGYCYLSCHGENHGPEDYSRN